jgi:ribosome-associated protein
MSIDNPLVKQILHVLDEMKAIDVVTLDVHKQTAITDYMIIATGRSSRHVKSIAEKTLEHLKSNGRPALSSSGIQSGEWALIDFGDCIVHLMHPETRAFYNLEALWSELPE